MRKPWAVRGRWLTALALASSSFAIASPPTAPTGLTAVSASSTQINLSWTASTDNLQITGYVIKRCLGSTCTNFAQVGSVASGTAYTDSGLAAATTYRYEVYGTDSTGGGPVSNIASATTLAGSVASSVTYAYDALGRLLQANVAANSTVENYTYDSAGNLTSITSSPVGTLEVANLSTPQGSPGSTITIVGSGFSTTPSSDTVKFNGVQATVTSATSTQLVVSVPTGATNGPITVKTGSTTVSSPGSFTVTSAAGTAPTISFSPLIAAPGSIITIQGSGFQTNLADDKVLVNDSAATVIAATSTTMQVLVPNIIDLNTNDNSYGVGSGLISITTPYGTATSTSPLIITHQAYTSVGATTVNGTAVNLSATTTVYSIVTFTGTAGASLAIGLSNVTPSGTSVSLNVVAPTGVNVLSKTVLGNGGAQIPSLPISGTYAILVGGGTSLTLNLLGPVGGTLALNGTPTNVTLGVPGQAASLTFSGTQNAYVTLAFSNVTISTATVTILNPDGTTLTALPLGTSGATYSPQLPQTGTYTVVVVPRGSSGGSFTAALTSTSSPTLTANQAPYNLTLTNSNPVTLSFNGAVGQYLSLSGIETSGSIYYITVTLFAPDGTQLASNSWSVCSTCRGQVLTIGPLTQSGSYSAVVQQSGSPTGTLALALSTPVVQAGSLGTTNNATVSILGQGASETFSGNAGQYVSAAFTSAWSGTPGTVSIIGVDGTTLASAPFTGNCGGSPCNATGVVSFGPLPSTGTYTALIQQTYGGWGDSTGTVSLTLEPAVQGTLTMGTPAAVPVLFGQGFYETFSGTAGQSVSVALQASASGATITSGTISVLDPNGVPLGKSAFTGSCPSSCAGSGVIDVGPFDLSGTYTVIFQQSNGAVGPAAGTITVTPELPVAGTLTVGTPSNVTLAAGQGLAQTVNGTAGQYLSVALSSSGSSAITSGTITLLSPTGAVLITAPYSGSCSGSCSGAGNVNLGPLPTTGTYTVVFQQTDGGAGPAAASVSVTVEAAVTGALTVGTPALVSLTSGQGIQKTFSGTTGQYDTVTVSETSSSIQGATVSVLTPSGALLATGTLSPSCSSTCTGAVSVNLGPLPATGTYTLLVQQASEAYGFGTGSLTVSVTNNPAGPGTTQNLSTSIPGQTAQFTFLAAASQTFSLTFSNMVFTPSSVTSYSVVVTAPDSSTVYSNYCYSASCYISLSGPITQSGTYTVKVTPNGSATMTGTATLAPTLTGTLTLGTPANLTLLLGQGVAYTFSASAGQTVALYVSGVTTSPANAYYSYNVMGPNGLSVGSAYTSSGTTINLPSLAGGTYTFQVSPGNPTASSTMQVTLAAGVSDPLPLNGSGVNISTSTPGENAYVTFPASFGQSVSLAITNLVFTPNTVTSAQITVPVSSVLGVPSSSCSGPGCEVHMAYLLQAVTSTYTASLAPAGAATMSFTATLSPDVTATLPWGTPYNLTLSETGQSALLTFDVSPGSEQNALLSFNNIVTTPSSANYYAALYYLDQGYASQGGNYLYNGTNAIRNLQNLAPGSYVLLVTPSTAAVGTLQITLNPGPAAMLTPGGTAQNVVTSTAGQDAYLTFDATAGQSLSLAITNLSFTPTGGSASVYAYAPNGSSLGSASCAPASPPICTLSLPALPQTGTYTIQVTPPTQATASLTATLLQDVTGTLVSTSASNVTISTAGQNAALSFNVLSAQTVTINATAISTTPANTPVAFTVYNSSSTQVGSTLGLTTATLSLPNTPAGAYTLVIAPSNGATGSMQITGSGIQ